MATRKVYVYRLIVTYPPGSLAPGWEPDGWESDLFISPHADEEFRWPRPRLYFSASGANKRAALFRSFGARVTVERSDPVMWTADDGTTACTDPSAPYVAHKPKEG